MAITNFNGFCDGSYAQPEKYSTPFFSPPRVALTPNSPFSSSQFLPQKLGQHHIQESSRSHYSEMEVSTSGYIQRSTLRQAPLCSYCRRLHLSVKMSIGRSESLTSISNQNGDPAHSIVIANKKIMDTDLEQKGQNIKIQNPRAITDVYQLEEKLQSALNGLRNYKKLFALASSHLPPARTTSFIVLVPLIVFCARCIIGASYARVFGTLRLETVDKREGEHLKFKSGHWRSALRDIRELDGLDCESPMDSTSPSEDEQISVEDLSHAYKKLDQDYQKFLSECGLSKWGYWRGGTQRDLNRNE